MVDALKIAAKVAVIAVVTGLVIGLLSGIVIPSVNLNPIREGIGFAKAIYEYYCGGFIGAIITLGIALLALRYIAIPTVKMAFIAIKWIMSVNK